MFTYVYTHTQIKYDMYYLCTLMHYRFLIDALKDQSNAQKKSRQRYLLKISISQYHMQASNPSVFDLKN